MNKRELILARADKVGLPYTRVASITDTTLDVISETLSKGEDVSIRSFGRFSTKTIAERKVQHPTTKKEVVIPVHRKIQFKQSNRKNC